MTFPPSALKIVLVLLASLASTPNVPASTQDTIALVEGGRPVCKIIVVHDGKDGPLLERSAQLITDTVQNWSGARLAILEQVADSKLLPGEPAIVLTTLCTLKKLSPELAKEEVFLRASEIDAQGFIVVPRTNNQSRQLYLVSQTPRGVFNAAVYLRDFCIDGTKEQLTVVSRPVVRSPKLGGRAAYTLTIWGNEAQYTAADWETIFDQFARDGIDRVYFWVSGHFPSQKFPQTYQCKTVEDGKTYDTTVGSKIGTVADLQEIVHSAHERGLRIYLGGGLGSWCGTIYLTNGASETMKQGPKEQSLCPSHPQSRRALVDYYQELFTAIPEADGLFIESADEVGECKCSRCSRAIDDLGSKQFGQSQLTLCREIMDAIWRDHPHARLAYTIGYAEHVNDPAYYKIVKQMSGDPRFEWMEARDSWSFPGQNGEARPAPEFSGQVMHWKQWYNKPLQDLVGAANRANKEKWYGLIWSFEPGYATGSFYTDIPFPTDLLPYTLTGFAFREVTWDPHLAVAEMLDRTHKRFFGKEAPDHLSADLWRLREIIRTRKGLNELSQIEDHIREARLSAGPKTLDGLNLMTRATDDIRKHLSGKRVKK